MGCFRDAVLAGRPAEMIDREPPTDTGGIATLAYRYTGSGAITLLRHDNEFGWRIERVAMELGVDATDWGGSTFGVQSPIR